MNAYVVALIMLLVIVLAILVIIRDAISVDPAIAKASLQNFAARFSLLFKKKAP